MKHIKEILAQRAASLFGIRSEKGSREWSAFNAVRDDRIEIFRVSSPRMHEVPRYPNIVHINRYPRHLTVRLAR